MHFAKSPESALHFVIRLPLLLPLYKSDQSDKLGSLLAKISDDGSKSNDARTQLFS